jgi:cytochrome c oxidase cbb3-type subunit 3
MNQRSVSMRRAIRLGVSGLLCMWLSALGWAQPPAGPPAGPAGPGAPAGPGGPGGAGPGGAPQRRAGESPASERRPLSQIKQTYPAAQIEAGQQRFAAMCGFCHGRDAAGGESGPDLTRSELVAGDLRGNKLIPMIRSGRPEKGMPPFAMSDADFTSIVAFIHDATVKAAELGGGRRSVDVADLQTGSADAGKAYFNGAGGCATCHQVTGSFATVGARYSGLPLLQRMLYPGSGGRQNNPPPAPAVMTVKTGDGKTVTGKLVYRDEFTITVLDAEGWNRSWPVATVTITGEDPLKAHIDQLGKYTEANMHDVYAYLATLR